MSADWERLLNSAIDGESLWQLVLSRPLLAAVRSPKITVRPLELHGELRYQAAERRGPQEFHDNLTAAELKELVRRKFGEEYGDLHWFAADGDFTARTKGAGAVGLKRKAPTKAAPSTEHNRSKERLIPAGVRVPFLVEIGVMAADGSVRPSMYHKFRQINRYLEFIEDVLPELPAEGPLRVVDFGCGKSYLTFALHHLLTVVHRREAEIVGLDRKLDVLRHCAEISARLHCRGLRFAPGEIHTYQPAEPVHMAVALHACDTATDDALAAAMRWGCRVILAAPCCQHELNQLLPDDVLLGITGYGLFRERFAAMATDALRARYLEARGWQTQVLEFIDTEHTPKNVLLRAVRQPHWTDAELGRRRQLYRELKRDLGLPTWHLERAGGEVSHASVKHR